MRFLKEEDYSPLIRGEIQKLLLDEKPGSPSPKLMRAEAMALAQVSNYLFGRYDTDSIFKVPPEGAPDTRDAYLVMLLIDCALYHLYSALAPDRMPEHRENRYEAALNWLREIAQGKISARLPSVKGEKGEDLFDFRLSSKKHENNRW